MKHSMANKTPRVRRFEPGASGLGNDDFLKKRGYTVRAHSAQAGRGFKVTLPGAKKPRRLGAVKLIALLDEERIKSGLEPIMRKHKT